MPREPTRREFLLSLAAVGAALVVGLPGSTKASIPCHIGRVLIVDDGSFGSYPVPLGEKFTAQGFGVDAIDFAEEGIALASLHDYDAVILGPRLSAPDRAWLQLAVQIAKIPTPMLTA
jgi:hypothetical protein